MYKTFLTSIISEVPSVPTIIARSNYGSRVPRTGDKNVEAVILSDPDRTWTSDMTCEFNGCQIQMELYYRSDRDQYYYKCSGNSHVSSIPGLDEGHRYKKLTTITKSSFWYKRKAAAHKILGAMMDYMRKEDMKVFIKPRHRTVRSAPGKLLEYLWFIDNKEDVMGGMARFLREVKFSDNTGIIETGDNNQGSFEPDMFTEARSGETPEQQERREDRDQSNFEAWVNRRRARDEEELDEDSTTDEESDDDDPSFIIPSFSTPRVSELGIERQTVPVTRNNHQADQHISEAPSTTPPRQRGRPRVNRGRGRPSSSRRS
ncbi:hypothetical protein INT48_007614 [Thamnidium elegans]|uniref:Uncharacterized protein n=1 Tax=Thamnidium elegans TaxID=101142 RepID=A0A8H7SI60_9FUNG|nr:hypothetical protein INT48_007614 [Thamnidium elegans]